MANLKAEWKRRAQPRLVFKCQKRFRPQWCRFNDKTSLEWSDISADHLIRSTSLSSQESNNWRVSSPQFEKIKQRCSKADTFTWYWHWLRMSSPACSWEICCCHWSTGLPDRLLRASRCTAGGSSVFSRPLSRYHIARPRTVRRLSPVGTAPCRPQSRSKKKLWGDVAYRKRTMHSTDRFPRHFNWTSSIRSVGIYGFKCVTLV